MLMKNLKSFYNWHPNPPFYYGWLALFIAGLGAFVATGIAQTVFGGIQDFIVEDMNWDRKTIALAATLGTWSSGVVAISIGRMIDKFGPRLIMPLAALIVGIGSIYLSNVKTIWGFFIIYIIIRAIAGPSLQNLIPRTIAVNFFSRQRNLAMGITTFNRIFGESINLQIITNLATKYSWRFAYRSLGFMTIPLCIPIFMIIRHKPEDIGQFPDGDKEISESKKRNNQNEKILTFKQILQIRSFWFILLGEFIAGVSTTMLLFQIVPFLTDGGLSQQRAAIALTVGNLLGGISVPIWGYLTDKFSTKRIAALILSLAIIPTILISQLNIESYGFILSIIWTTITGSILVLGSMMYGTVFNRKSYGSVAGLTGPSRTTAVGLGPTLGAYIISFTKSYQPIFWGSAIGYLVAIGFFTVVNSKNTEQ